MHQEQGQRGGGHAGYATRLSDGLRTMPGELLPDFRRQAPHFGVVERGRNGGAFPRALPLDLLALALDVAVILRLDLHLFRDAALGMGRRDDREAGERVITHLGATQQLERALLLPGRRAERLRLDPLFPIPGPEPDRAEAGLLAGDGVALLLEGAPALVAHQAEPAPVPGEPKVRVVLAQQQAVLGAAREHAVGLRRAEGDEIVDEHADVRFVPPRAPLLPPQREGGGVQARDDAPAPPPLRSRWCR